MGGIKEFVDEYRESRYVEMTDDLVELLDLLEVECAMLEIETRFYYTLRFEYKNDVLYDIDYSPSGGDVYVYIFARDGFDKRMEIFYDLKKAFLYIKGLLRTIRFQSIYREKSE